MINLTIQSNKANNKLFCIYSKDRIEIGERYITVYENYLGEIIEKYYKLEHIGFVIDE